MPDQSIDVVGPELTREIFGNIPAWSQVWFYAASAFAVAIFCVGVTRRLMRWRRGRSEGGSLHLTGAFRRLVVNVLLLSRMRGRPLASLAHRLLFGGFVVLFIGTSLIAVEHLLASLLGREPADPVFHQGIYYGLFELAMDAAGIALVVGCGMFLYRHKRGSDSFEHRSADRLVLWFIIIIGVTGYLVEGLRIIDQGTPLPGLSPVGLICGRGFQSVGMTPDLASQAHFCLWWVHAVLALSAIALLPYTRLIHGVAGAVNLAMGAEKPGVMRAVDIAQVEETGKVGAETLNDFTIQQIVQLDACVSCGRCEDACPAFEAGTPLSPRRVVQDLHGCYQSTDLVAEEAAPILPGETISEATLWSCTTCGSCTDVCPLGVSPMGMITDMRRHLVANGKLRGAPATALQKTGRVRNPWGLSPADRLKWAEGLDVPVSDGRRQFEYLYWVGCAAAYDRRTQKVARSVATLLKAASVDFAVLGVQEGCTGETARRMGDELLFQDLAQQNVARFAEHGVQKIVAHCPHCVNSLRHDYPHVGGNYQVIHHSQLLAQLVDQGKLPAIRESGDGEARRIAYHDPCYLARANNTVDEPRAVLASAVESDGSSLIELDRSGRNTACCGGGGGKMWFDDQPSERVGRGRVEEIRSSGASTLAVSCPFCLTMLKDGLASVDAKIEVRDISELLVEAIERAGMESSKA